MVCSAMKPGTCSGSNSTRTSTSLPGPKSSRRTDPKRDSCGRDAAGRTRQAPCGRWRCSRPRVDSSSSPGRAARHQPAAQSCLLLDGATGEENLQCAASPASSAARGWKKERGLRGRGGQDGGAEDVGRAAHPGAQQVARPRIRDGGFGASPHRAEAGVTPPQCFGRAKRGDYSSYRNPSLATRRATIPRMPRMAVPTRASRAQRSKCVT